MCAIEQIPPVGTSSGWCTLGIALLLALVPTGTTAASIGGPFQLIDQHGQTRTDEDFRGDYLIIYFGSTFCPDTCRTALLKISPALEDFGAQAPVKARQVTPLFISVDSERHTPETLLSYARHFHPSLVALTGPGQELDRVSCHYGAFFAKVPNGEPDLYLMDHTSFVYLIGLDGRYLERFESDVTVTDLVDALRRLVLVAATGNS